MTVSWDEVLCYGQNETITGYLLYYTNITFSDSINITGGNNKQCNLPTFTAYTNYTVIVIAYNGAGTGATSSEVIKLIAYNNAVTVSTSSEVIEWTEEANKLVTTDV